MTSIALARLTHRKLLKISGPDCFPYLQGLLCNDVRYLYEPKRIPRREYAKNSHKSLSAFMLNAQGRAICDMILYRTTATRDECQLTSPGQATEYDELLIECDSSLASGIANTLYGYRVRRKISLSMEEGTSVWCLFPKRDQLKANSLQPQGDFSSSLIETDSGEFLDEKLTVVNDPRLANMGLRILSTTQDSKELKQRIQAILNQDIIEATLKDYTLHRYNLGVGEGVKDHPESNCLPLECNADYLGSVSFNKGCYLGQELTARIHFTGVVRKRLMPLTVDLESTSKKTDTIPLINGTELLDGASKKKVGLIRNVVQNRALALIRHDLIGPSRSIVHSGSDTILTAHMPYWWKQN